RPLLIVGGGEAADVVRRWDEVHRLGEERAHWLALRSLRLNEALLLQLLSESRLVKSREAAGDAWAESQIPVLCAHDFLRADESHARSHLPHTWDVTSDSVAAWIAIHWPADELVLLKSTSRPDADGGVVEAVDPYFRELRPQLPHVGWVNLGSDHFEIEPWIH
ncbi:MAG: hypothetical protein ABIG44_09000, partial [Planctomycetota bacterium]